MTSDGIIDLTDEARSEILAQNKSMADQALRVMASARRDWGTEAPLSYDPANLEHDMVFVGLSGMIDPVRPEVKGAVAEAHSAGMRTVMITGDHIDTAVAIAIELGIITDRSQAITGAQLDKISDEEFEQRIETIGVYARVQPEHKVRIVDTWRKKGMVTAMTATALTTLLLLSALILVLVWALLVPTLPRALQIWFWLTITLPPSLAPAKREDASTTTFVSASSSS